jgi:superoxide reductase
MYDRRDLLKTTAIAASVFAVGSISPSLTAAAVPYLNIVYTKDNPGKWAERVASHAPKVTVTGASVAIVTDHRMTPEHYIVRQTLVLEDGTPVGAKTFTATDKPESTFELPAGYKGKFYATSFCNLHDLWLTEVTV